MRIVLMDVSLSKSMSENRKSAEAAEGGCWQVVSALRSTETESIVNLASFTSTTGAKAVGDNGNESLQWWNNRHNMDYRGVGDGECGGYIVFGLDLRSEKSVLIEKLFLPKEEGKCLMLLELIEYQPPAKREGIQKPLLYAKC